MNISQHTTLNIAIEAEKNRRNSVSESFKEKLHLNNVEAKKATYRLQKIMVNGKKKLYPVDIFISDKVPVMDIESIQVPNYSFSIEISGKKRSSTFKHNGKNITAKEAQEIIELDKSRQKELRERYKWARQQNLETVIKTLQADISTALHDKLFKALEKGVSYISLALDSQTIAKLLKNTNGAISDMDIHLNFATSGAEQEPHAGDSVDMAAWRARFNSYLDETHANQRQAENYNAWSGTDIGIYYSDVECPSEDDVFNEVATFTGYTPPSADNYDIFYLDGDSANNGNLIDHRCPDDEDFEECAYNIRIHTRVITGILSTVAPEANLFCKSAEFSSFEADDYSDENITVYEDIIPTEAEMQSIDIESYSLNRGNSSNSSDNTRDYYPMDRVFDNHAYDYNVPIFISAANYDDVISPAKAFNVITVGNYGYNEDSLTVLNSTSSSFNNPLLEGNLSKSYQKPEISAPGSDFFTLLYNDVEFFNYNGTSFSTPFTAALTADVMSHFHSLDPSYDFLVQGALYKAVMIGLARDYVYVEDTQGFNNRYFTGEGGADMWAMKTTSAIYNTNNQSTIFSENINGKMCYTGWNANLSRC